MMSTFGWLDGDPEQRRRMLEVVDLFREQGTLDDLGIGAIRDALANSMFPGTSEIHTRLRYVLFVPWLLRRAADRGTPSQMAEEFQNAEYRLIDSLLAGGERRGVIGNTARRSLKRMPSGIYWSALSAWGIHTSNFSADSFFRREHDYRIVARRTPRADDPEAGERPPHTGIDAYLPSAPKDLMKSTSFMLTPDEEQYLSDRIARSVPGSMLAWLVQNPPGNIGDADHVWDIDNLREAPEPLFGLVDHARRFHIAIDGAGLLYRLLLARAAGRDDSSSQAEADLASWREELAETEALIGWDRVDWWATVRRQNPRLGRPTAAFVDTWLDLIATDTDLAGDPSAADLISTRERRLKGARARLANRAALDRWSGGGGRYGLRFRWGVNRSHLTDLYTARGNA